MAAHILAAACADDRIALVKNGNNRHTGPRMAFRHYPDILEPKVDRTS